MYELLRSFNDPLTLFYLLMATSLGIAWRRSPDGRKSLQWVLAVFALGWLACTPLVAFFAAGALEWQHQPVLTMPADAEAIVLLSGGSYSGTEHFPLTRPACDTQRRCRFAAMLYHQRPCTIVACGGTVGDLDDDENLASVMQKELIDRGVAAEDILVEPESVDTHTNAVQANTILGEHGFKKVVLVTDATHLPRSIACFEKLGVEVIPAGAHYEASQFRLRVAALFPNSRGARRTSIAWHEYVGLVWYKLRGKI